MALFFHGYRRFTEDLHILVTPDGLRQIHRELEGLGYVPLLPASKNLRDAEYGVRIELKLASGSSPGRRRDLGNVQVLIRILDLPEEFAEQLDPSVREVYHELWVELRA